MSSSSSPSHEPQVVQIRLLPAQTADEQRRHIVANVVIEGAATSVPYIDDPAATATSVSATQLEAAARPEPQTRLRYYAVGPGTFRIRCPLCRQHGDAAVMRGPKMKDASCCLSTLSCFFPLFWLCCLCTWCGCNSEWTTKGLYCNRCGGKLGKQRKVK